MRWKRCFTLKLREIKDSSEAKNEPLNSSQEKQEPHLSALGMHWEKKTNNGSYWAI